MKKLIEVITSIVKWLSILSAEQRTVFNIAQAMVYLELSEGMLHKLTSKKIIPYSKPSGKIIFIKKKDLDAWAFSNRVTPLNEI